MEDVRFAVKKKDPSQEGPLKAQCLKLTLIGWCKYGANLCSNYFDEGFKTKCKKLIIRYLIRMFVQFLNKHLTLVNVDG